MMPVGREVLGRILNVTGDVVDEIVVIEKEDGTLDRGTLKETKEDGSLVLEVSDDSGDHITTTSVTVPKAAVREVKPHEAKQFWPIHRPAPPFEEQS